MRVEFEEIGYCKFVVRKGEKWILEIVAKNFKKYEGPLRTVVDIGAHIGELSILAAKRGAECVWAIEPDIDNFHMLLHNIEENNMEEQVIPLFFAVWDKMGVTRIKLPKKIWKFWRKRNSGQRSIIYKSKFPENIVCAPTITLEWLLANLIPTHVDYLKMDIEGAEHAVLLTTPVEVMRKVRFIDLDLHDPSNTDYFDSWNQWSSEGTLKHLSRCGFNVQTDIREGRIIAYNKEAMLE